MSGPMTLTTREVAPEIFLLGTHLQLPMGMLPVNAFLIRGPKPVLIDTGLPLLAGAFEEQLAKLIDLRDLAILFITHADSDHVGALPALLKRAPGAKVVTTFQGLGKMSLRLELSPDRVHLLNPGQRLAVGDREFLAAAPPTYDAPETTMVLETRSRTLFSADAFGALLPAAAEDAAALPAAALRDGMATWTTIDAPWIHDIEAAALARSASAVRDLAPGLVLSSHLPPARGMSETLLANLVGARSAPRFVGPDQEALMRMAG